MTRKDIVDAWATIRKKDNTIPDDVLDFMKDAALTLLPEDKETDHFKITINDGFCVWEYKMKPKDHGDISIEMIKDRLFKFYKSPDDSGKLIY